MRTYIVKFDPVHFTNASQKWLFTKTLDLYITDNGWPYVMENI